MEPHRSWRTILKVAIVAMVASPYGMSDELRQRGTRWTCRTCGHHFVAPTALPMDRFVQRLRARLGLPVLLILLAAALLLLTLV